MKRGLILRTLGAFGIEERARKLRYTFSPGGVLKEASAGGAQLKFYCSTPDMADEVSGLGGEQAILETFVAQLRQGETVWDVGANLGLYALFSAGKMEAGGSVYAFEPEAATCRTLERNVRVNDLPNVRVMPYALGDTDGSALLFAGADGITTVSNLVPLGGAYRTERTGASIRLRRADSVLKERPEMAPHVVKIDVEGAELRVLRGFGEEAWRSVRRFLIEVHPELLPLHDATADQVGQWLADRGFSITSETRRRKEMHWLCDRKP